MPSQQTISTTSSRGSRTWLEVPYPHTVFSVDPSSNLKSRFFCFQMEPDLKNEMGDVGCPIIFIVLQGDRRLPDKALNGFVKTQFTSHGST